MQPKPTESELQILQILWQKGPSTVRMVNDILSEKRETGYTTTLKLMQIMHDKELVSREKAGKSHIYTAAVSQDITRKQLVDELLTSAFGGSAMKLVMSALGNSQASAEEIQQIRALLDQIEDEES